MHKRKMWFDALRERVAEAEKSGEISLPGLDFFDITELNNDLENAELLLVSHDVVKQLVENGTAPEDLRAGFQMPFERSFIEVDPAVRLAECHFPTILHSIFSLITTHWFFFVSGTSAVKKFLPTSRQKYLPRQGAAAYI